MRLDVGPVTLAGELHPATRPRRNAILLHGFAGTRRDWDSLLPAFQPETNAIALDLPGHGDSTTPRSAMGFDAVADALAGALDGLQLERAVWVGYSLGARILLPFALRHPERVEALVLVSVHPGLNPAERSIRRLQDEADARLLEERGVDVWLEQWHARPAFATRRRNRDAWRAEVERKRRTNRAPALARALRDLGLGAQPDLLARAAEIEAPTLLIAGGLDAPYVAWATALSNLLPHARKAIVPDVGHAPHLEAPEATQATVREFLTSLSPRIPVRGP